MNNKIEMQTDPYQHRPIPEGDGDLDAVAGELSSDEMQQFFEKYGARLGALNSPPPLTPPKNGP